MMPVEAEKKESLTECDRMINNSSLTIIKNLDHNMVVNLMIHIEKENKRLINQEKEEDQEETVLFRLKMKAKISTD